MTRGVVVAFVLAALGAAWPARAGEDAWRQHMQQAAEARRSGIPSDAIPELLLALKEAEAFTPPDERLFMTVAGLAETYEVGERFADAERFYARGIVLVERLGGAREAGFVELLDRHAAVLRKLGRSAEAQRVEARSHDAAAALARLDAGDAAAPKFRDRSVRQWMGELASPRRLTAMQALQSGDPAALPVLVALAKSTEGALRSIAMAGVAALGPGAREALPLLSDGLADRDLNVRYAAATGLRNLGKAAAPAVPALIQALSTSATGTPGLEGPPRYYSDARAVAAEALGSIGPAAREALPKLREVAEKDEDEDVRAAAAAAVRRIEEK